MTRAKAIEVTGGGLSEPSKMPGMAYGLPARACLLGSKLVKIPGTTCHGCYALKGNYVRFPSVANRQQERLESITHPQWEEGMTQLIRESGSKYFRWHDSGDLQSLAHLERIVRVCQALPQVKFWLPTREYAIVEAWRGLAEPKRAFPDNLVVRLSAHLVDGPLPSGYGLPTSSVHSTEGEVQGKLCRASERGNECGRCRACWDIDVKNVSYHKH